MSYTPPNHHPYSPAPIEFRIGLDQSVFSGKFGAAVGYPKITNKKTSWERDFKDRIETMERSDPKTFIGWALKAFWK